MKKIALVVVLGALLAGCMKKNPPYTINLPDSTPDPNVELPAF